ncbi:tetratricopeptide repeat-containing protein, partial [Thiorhodococcus mannitoliphagus]
PTACGRERHSIQRRRNYAFRPRWGLALFYARQGRYAEAEPLYKRVLTLGENAVGPEHPDVATSLDNLASLYGSQGRYAEAESFHKRALALREEALGLEHPDVAVSLNNLGSLYESQGHYAKAEPLHKQALVLSEQASYAEFWCMSAG